MSFDTIRQFVYNKLIFRSKVYVLIVDKKGKKY